MKKVLNVMAIIAVLLFTTILIAVGIFAKGNNESKFEMTEFSLIGQYSIDGENWKPIEGEIDAKKSDTVIFYGRLSCDIKNGEDVWLRLENAGVGIKINGEKVFSAFEKKGDFPKMFRSPGYSWEYFVSPGISTEDNIEITVKSYSKGLFSAQALIQSLCYGDGIGFYPLLLKSAGIWGLFLLLAMLGGLVYLLEGIIDLALSIRGAKRILLCAFYLLSGGLWGLTDALYPYLSFLTVSPWLTGVIDMLGVFLFPIAITLFVRYFMRGKLTQKIMTLNCWSTVIFALTAFALQLAGIADLLDLLKIIGIFAMAQLITVIACIVKEIVDYRDHYLTFLLLTVIPVFLAFVFDFINLIFAFAPNLLTMQYAISVSFFILIYELISYGKAEKVKSVKFATLEKQLEQSRTNIMLSQIQPHFLYNALGTIRALCPQDAELARTAINKFSKYLRTNMDSLTQDKPISFETELEHTKNYIYIEQLRFGDKLNVCYDLKTTNFYCPPLTLQPLVENAVKHGIIDREYGGTVTVRTIETDLEYVLTVSDDGVGFDVSKLKSDKDESTHIGLSNTDNRLRAMCGASLTLASEIGKGTTVTVTIPKSLKNNN